MDVMKLSMLALIVVIACQMLTKSGKDYVMLICVSFGLLIAFGCVQKLATITDDIKYMMQSLGQSASYLKLLCKIVVMTCLADFSSNMCKDAGYFGIAGQIELFCKIGIIVISLPVMVTLLQTTFQLYE